MGPPQRTPHPLRPRNRPPLHHPRRSPAPPGGARGGWGRGRAGARTYGPRSEVQRELVTHLVSDVNSFFRLSPAGAAEGRRGKGDAFMSELQTLRDTDSGGLELETGSIPTCGALGVTFERARLPDEAAVVDPGTILSEPRRSIFQNLTETIKLPRDQWPRPLPRAVHKVARSEEGPLFREMIKRGMAKLLPEAEVLPEHVLAAMAFLKRDRCSDDSGMHAEMFLEMTPAVVAVLAALFTARARNSPDCAATSGLDTPETTSHSPETRSPTLPQSTESQ